MRIRRLSAVLAAPLLVLSLAACANYSDGGDEPDVVGTDTPTACAPSGPISEAVKVSGDFDTEPTVDFNAPLTVSAVQRTVVTKGDGAELQDGASAQIHFSLYNGSTGDTLDSTGYDPAQLFSASVDETALLPGLVKLLRCSTVGSRVVGVVPPSDAFGDAGNEQLGVEAGQTLVFVVDVVGVTPTQAEGDMSPLPDGFPKVTWADNGQPTVEIGGLKAPTELKIATVITGKGEKVAEGDNVTVQYQGVNWTSGKVFDESWSRGTPSSFATNQVIPGFGAALVGQTVGSRVVVLIPPAEGYGANGNSGAGISGTDTLVFVIDILATAAA